MIRVKACGIARSEDAELAVQLGAWALGLIFVPASPRACQIETAEEIGATLRRRVELTGVFVNATLDAVTATAERCSLSILQLHGDEGPAYCREAARRTGCRVMKAARVRNPASVKALRAYRVDLHLLDTYSARIAGGTGATFDWDLTRFRDRSIPLVLSGGLTPDNVGEAVEAVHPWAVDTASGTEARPGAKDPARLRAFFRAVEAADARLEAPAPETTAPSAGTDEAAPDSTPVVA